MSPAEAFHELQNVANFVGDQSKKIRVYEIALGKLAKLGNGDRPGSSEGNVIAQRALLEAM